MSTMTAETAPRRSWRRIALLIAAAVILVFVAANAHLVYVAVTSQPDCVPHVKAIDGSVPTGSFRAAKSAC